MAALMAVTVVGCMNQESRESQSELKSQIDPSAIFVVADELVITRCSESLNQQLVGKSLRGSVVNRMADLVRPLSVDRTVGMTVTAPSWMEFRLKRKNKVLAVYVLYGASTLGFTEDNGEVWLELGNDRFFDALEENLEMPMLAIDAKLDG